MTGAATMSMKDLTTEKLPGWCPGCGDFNILFNLKAALVELKLPPEQVVVSTGIGCGSKINHFLKGIYGFEGLHGRSLPVATGAKLANNSLTVIAVVGDGDCYGIGGNHLIHTMRRNLNMTLLVQDNAVYGLTKGQYSPTSRPGFRSPSSPFGALETPVNPIALGLTMGATYVARGYAYEAAHLKKLIADGIRHKGFSLIDILQPCTTYNKVNTISWFRERIYKLHEAGHNPTNREHAWRRSWEWDEKVPIGLFYREDKPTYDDAYSFQKPMAMRGTSIDITSLLTKFT